MGKQCGFGKPKRFAFCFFAMLMYKMAIPRGNGIGII